MASATSAPRTGNAGRTLLRWSLRLVVVAYLFLLVAWPVSLVVTHTFEGGPAALQGVLADPDVQAALRLTLLAAVVGFLDLFAIPTATPAFRTALLHMTLNLLVTAAYVVNFLWRHADYTDGGSVGIGRLVLSAVSVAALGVSGFLGGKLAYRYGVRVADERTQAEGYTTGGRPRNARPAA